MAVICAFLNVYLIICVARVILSWLPSEGGGVLSAVATLVYTVTEPVFATVRRSLPVPGDLPLDLSPMVVILVLGFFRNILC